MLRHYNKEPGQKYKGREWEPLKQRDLAMEILVDWILGQYQWPKHAGSDPPEGMIVAYVCPSIFIRVLHHRKPALIPVWQVLYGYPDAFDWLNSLLADQDRFTNTTSGIEIDVEVLVKRIGQTWKRICKCQDYEREDNLRGADQLERFGLPYDQSQNALRYTCPAPNGLGHLRFPKYLEIIHGTKDDKVSIEDTRRFLKIMKSAFPDVRVEVCELPGAGHPALSASDTEDGPAFHAVIGEFWNWLLGEHTGREGET